MDKPSPPTRDRILEAAGKLFYAEGFRAISMDGMGAWRDGFCDFDKVGVHGRGVGTRHDQGRGCGAPGRRPRRYRPMCSGYRVARGGGFRAQPRSG